MINTSENNMAAYIWLKSVQEIEVFYINTDFYSVFKKKFYYLSEANLVYKKNGDCEQLIQS